MLQNSRVTAFNVSELLMEKQQGGGGGGGGGQYFQIWQHGVIKPVGIPSKTKGKIHEEIFRGSETGKRQYKT